MATETTKRSPTPLKVARAYFDALSKRDLAAAIEVIGPKTADDFVPIGEIRGMRFFDALLAAFPDLDLTVDRIVADRSTAVVEWRATGTFSGASFQGVEPTGKPIDIRGVCVMEITGGRVRTNTIHYDGFSLARQIGLLPHGEWTEGAMVSAFNVVTRLRQRLIRRLHPALNANTPR